MNVTRIPLHKVEQCLPIHAPKNIAKYVALLQAGSEPPPVLVYFQPRAAQPYRLVDGAHRTLAAQLAGRKNIDAVIMFDADSTEDVRPLRRRATRVRKNVHR
jgi:hypothetical protein